MSERPKYPGIPLAVALEYRKGSADLPKVTAAGRGRIAERIIDAALAADVPVRQNEQVAQLLVDIDPGSSIPPAAMVAVAQLLSFLYRMEKREDGSGLPVGAQPIR